MYTYVYLYFSLSLYIYIYIYMYVVFVVCFLAHIGVCQQTHSFPFVQALTRSPAAETAIQPLIWSFES